MTGSNLARQDQALPSTFSVEEAYAAQDEWGMNCGPGAIAAVLGLTPAQLRPHMGDFEKKGYTNPSLMWTVLGNVGARFSYRGGLLSRDDWPNYGLARIQWEGPWTKPGVPARVAYRHTHWVGARQINGSTDIFDINAISEGGWLSAEDWSTRLVPWLLAECEPKASGGWWITHAVEIKRMAERRAA